jgi:BirA family biotin operon repressor/biotin-[acetyl-CoA-carboxylase] ligase
MNPITEWQLDTRQLGRRVVVYDVTDSTSTRCLALASDEQHHGVAVLARAQSEGRGQHGRSWLCQPGTGVLLSLLLFPPPQLRRPVLLTAWVAVSVCELIRALAGLQPRIKWPNDILIEGRKVCGILIEQRHGVVAGLGLNLNQSQGSFLADGLNEAGSLRLFSGEGYAVETVARQLLDQLDREYEQMLTGNLGWLEERWRSGLGLLGKTVAVEGHTATYHGQLVDLTFDRVMLDTEKGERLGLLPEQIKHVSLGEAETV